jgi:hypothetical protein
MRLFLWLGLLALVPSVAHAGRRPYINLWDTETLKKGDVELEQWLWTRKFTNVDTHGWIWFAPIFGVSERVELAFPWEAVITNTSTAISDFVGEARIRLGNLDDTAFVHHMLRVFAQQNFNHPYNMGRYGIPWFGGDYVVSFGEVAGSHATVDVGAYSDFRFHAAQSLSIQTLGLGYTYSVSKEVRVGGEYSHEIGLSDGYYMHRYFQLGPNFAYSRGPVWITFGTLLGLTSDSPDYLARFVFAVAI